MWRAHTLLLFAGLAFFTSGNVYSAPEDWMPSGAQVSTSSVEVEYVSPGHQLLGQALLGKLLFNTPGILGERATRMGLSCNSCHPAGHKNPNFFIPGLSNKPGHIDISHRFWTDQEDNKAFDPVEIPSLQNVSQTAPFGTVLEFTTLSDFTRHVIVNEFAGPEPKSETIDALVTYMGLLRTPDSGDQIDSPIPFANYLRLLEDPIAEGNIDKVRQRAVLLREELARRATQGKSEKQLHLLANKLRQLANVMTRDQENAAVILNEMIELAEDQ
ncbi:hypothetical protein [Sneathiella limimaris]|uniref:hypothetical protein n=1 Tax=Sneathiella limimaris TaxID=1964213 RepID=UPI00146DD7ED|nr:hypothetical protein [Sneathiella limimaris]